MKLLILALTLSFQTHAFAQSAEASAIAAVSGDVKKLSDILKMGSEPAKIRSLCQLVKTRVGLSTMASELLGSFGKLSRDNTGINQFAALLPSIMVSDFYSMLTSGAEYFVDEASTTRRGSGRIGVRVQWGNKPLVVVVSSPNNKILDIEWNGASLIKTKRSDFQKDLLNYFNADKDLSMPVTQLIQGLKTSGALVRCD